VIIDGHHHIVDNYEPILKRMDQLGIDGTVLVGVSVPDLSVVTIRPSLLFRSDLIFRTWGVVKARQILRSRALQESLMVDPRNDAVLRAVAARSDRFFGFAFVNPESPRALEIARSCLDAGLCGIKLTLFQYATDLAGDRMSALCELAREYRVPVFVHIGVRPESSNFEAPVCNFPEVNFILAHGGVHRFRDAIELARTRDNLFVDTSSYIVSPPKLKKLLESLGAGKLIFGTDVPVMARDPSEGLRKIEGLPLKPADRDLILGQNLLGLLRDAKPLRAGRDPADPA
jgi:predicted TIM-barrel fold metal-dependent hydrolase